MSQKRPSMPQKHPKQSAPGCQTCKRGFHVAYNPDSGGTMSRKLRALLAMVVLSFAFSAAACSNALGPHGYACADTNGGNVCR